MADTPLSSAPSARALFRYRVISEVLAAEGRGVVRREAVRQVADRVHLDRNGAPKTVSPRSIYRWLARFHHHGFVGLEDERRSVASTDGVLGPDLIEFLVQSKEADPRSSIPALLDLAVTVGLLDHRKQVDRTTVWRHLRRRGVSTRRQRHVRDQRRYEYAHRLQLVLCDGKHFRAGPTRARRVALFFIDDATRYVPVVVVGSSESAALFLRGLHRLLLKVGRFDAAYMDNGSGFIAGDSSAVLASLGIGHILGTEGYPQGRGKIERFNQTVDEHLLRHLTEPSVDPDFTALELRIAHFLSQSYNRWGHAAHGGTVSPLQRYLSDERRLTPYPDRTTLRRHFYVTEERTVSNDHVVKFGGVPWEVPRGLAGQRLELRRDVLEPGRLFLEHKGSWVRLHPVAKHENARQGRGRVPAAAVELTTTKGAALTSADQSLAPITEADGGYAEEKPKP